MRNQDINNKTTNKIEKTSIGNNSSLFANTINIGNASRKETQVLSRAETLQKRAGYIRTRINRRMSVGAQTTNTLMRSTIQLVLWLFVFVLSTMIVYFTNAGNNNNLLNMQNNVIAQGVNTFANESTRKGTGTSENPFQISTYADLVAVATSINSSEYASYQSKHYKLMDNISDDDGTSTATWTPIGSYTNSNYVFKGHFDGNNHTITFNKTVHITSSSNLVYGGLFGYVKGVSDTQKAEIKNLGVNWAGKTPVTVNNAQYKGLVVSSSSSSSSKVYAYAGGIAGYTDSSTTISNSYNTGTVTATSSSSSRFLIAYAGGIAGYANFSHISNSYNTGAVTATSTSSDDDASANAGGIAGYAFSSTTISNSYNTGAVTATSSASASSDANAGGIAGFALSSTISNCFSIGIAPSVTGSRTSVGGIVGDNNGGTINNCYYDYESLKDIENKGTYQSGLATNAKTLTFFTISTNWDGNYHWDFDESTGVWGIDTRTGISEADRINGGLPYLKWFEEYHITYVVPNESTNEEKIYYYGLKKELPSFTAQIFSIEEIGLTIPSGKEFIHWEDSNENTYDVGYSKQFTNNIVLTAVWIEYVNVSFNITTNVGVIFNICDNENNILQSIYVSAGSSSDGTTPTFTSTLIGGNSYKVLISAPYTSNIQHTTAVVGQQELVGRVLTLTVTDSDFSVTMNIIGYLGGNSIVV